MPNLREMATCMRAVDGGSVKALKSMGFLKEDDASVEGIMSAFRSYIAFCRDNSPSESLKELKENLLTAENSLCKIKRLEKFIKALSLNVQEI